MSGTGKVRRRIDFHVPEGTTVRRCSSCQASIVFVPGTRNPDARMVLDVSSAVPAIGGSRMESHRAHCPTSDQHPTAPVNAHPCAVPTCKVQIPMDRLMCRPHWFQVSSAVRSMIWRTVRQGVKSTAYKAARKAALVEVEKARRRARR